MYELITKDDWEFGADVEKTKEYYQTYSHLNCDACRNFYQVIRGYSTELTAFLEQFGITIEKPIKSEWFVIDKQSKTLDYTAYYAVHGAAAKGSYEIDFGMINVVVQSPENSPDTEMPEPYFVFQIFNLWLPWILSSNIETLNDSSGKTRKNEKENNKSKVSRVLRIIASLIGIFLIILPLLTLSGTIERSVAQPYLGIGIALFLFLQGIDCLMHNRKYWGMSFLVASFLTLMIYFIIPNF